MDVQQVQFVVSGHLGHARGQSQVIRRVLEQRIIRNRHLVKCDVLLAAAKAERL